MIWLTTPMQQRSKSGAIGITPLLVDVPPDRRFVSYLTFSIAETFVILRMVNDHPYGNNDLLRKQVPSIGKVTVRRQAPYPTEKWICFAVNRHINRKYFGRCPKGRGVPSAAEQQAPPLQYLTKYITTAARNDPCRFRFYWLFESYCHGINPQSP